MLIKRRSRVAARYIAVTFACMGLSPVLAHAQQPPPVDVAKPLAQQIVEYDVYTGRFEAVERVEIRSRVSGYLEEVGFEDGEIVADGALLFVIDQRTFRAEIARAEANVAAAEAQRALAQIELDRATTLAERKVGSIQVVDRATATMPLRKVATPEDIARAIVFLASDRLAGHISGAILPVAGGMEGRLLRL